MSKVLTKVVGTLVVSMCLGSVAYAGWNPVEHIGYTRTQAAAVSAPEIDPAGALSGLTLLLGGIAVVRGRRIKK